MKKKSATMKSWLSVVLGSAMVIGASSAYAINEVESNDTFATANTANTGSGSVTLSGSIGDITSVSNDVDIFSVSIGSGQNYSASINYTGLYNPIDVNPILNLFMESNGSYLAVASSDPDNFGTSLNFTAWTDGNYFLTVSSDFNNAQDAFGNNQSNSMFFTTESVLGTAFDSFAGGSFTSFDYSIASSAVSEPATAVLLGAGLIGLIGASRRRAK